MPNNLPTMDAATLAVIRAAANKTRTERSVLKGQINAGTVSLASVFDLGSNGTGDKICGRMRVGEAIRAIRGWGPKRTADLLGPLGVKPETHIDKIAQAKLASILSVVEPAE